MKPKLLSLLTAFVFPIVLFAQGPPPINQPQASPRATLNQVVGITNISVDYSRPGVKGREILGNLITMDQIWRAGANENTRISFDKDVEIGGKKIEAGTYGLHMIPGEEEWTIIINSDHESWGSYFYSEENDVVRLKTKMTKVDSKMEWLTYGFEKLDQGGANLYMHWDDMKISFPISVNTKGHMISYIEYEYLKNLAGFFWQGFNGAALYTLNNDVSLDKGLEWVNRSISMNKNFNNLSTKSLILRTQGKTSDADNVMKEAMPMADEVSMNAYGYALLYTLDEKDEAIKVFQKNVKDYPESWNVYDSLAEAQAANGDKKSAIKNFSKALEKAPENQKTRIKNTLKDLKG